MTAFGPTLRRLGAAGAALTLALGLTAVTGPATAQVVSLYDQYNNAASTSTNSQNYDAASDDLDNEAADDFRVPAGATWKIGTVEVAGVYVGSGRPTGVNVSIYRDEGGLPGERVRQWLAILPTGGFESPNFSLPLTDPPALAAGQYWLSVQVDEAGGSQWFWQNRSLTDLDPAVWRNEDGGSDVNICSDWEPRAATCAPGGGLAETDPDQVFRLLAVPKPRRIEHPRSVSLKFKALERLNTRGIVSTPDGFSKCSSLQRVSIQKKDATGEWIELKSKTTNQRGIYMTRVNLSGGGTFRVVVEETSFLDPALNTVDVCLKAQREKTRYAR